MKKQIQKMLEEADEGSIKQDVLEWLNDEEDPEIVLRDLQHGGCKSGMVGHLIYYVDTVKYYNNHKEEIEELIHTLEEGTGQTRIELFGRHLDIQDWFTENTDLRDNLLAWFGFEETASQIGYELGII